MKILRFGLHSLKTRITLITLGIFLISIWSLTFFVSASLKNDLQALLSNQQFSTATLLANEIDQDIADRLEALVFVASEITPAMLQRPSALRVQLEQRPMLARLFNHGVASAGLDGVVLADFPHAPGRIGDNFSEYDGVIGALKDGKAIRAMALLHESLYRAGTFAYVDLGAYLKQLASQSFRAQNTGSVRLQLELASVQVSLDQATPCGLLLNELISNCLKHGFPDGRSGEVHIELHALGAAGQWCLRVSDT